MSERQPTDSLISAIIVAFDYKGQHEDHRWEVNPTGQIVASQPHMFQHIQSGVSLSNAEDGAWEFSLSSDVHWEENVTVSGSGRHPLRISILLRTV